jgi:hypothetical protein
MLAPSVVPALGRVLRPAAKAVIKGGMVLYRDTIAEIGEAAGDLVAEARAELEEGNSQAKTETRRVGRGVPVESH